MTFRNISVALTGNATNLSSVLYKAGNDVEKFHKKAESGNLKTASSAKLMGAAFLAGGAAVAVGLGYAVAKAAAFDKAMRNVNSLTRLNQAGFEAMEKSVISLSTSLPQSATTLAEGLYDIAGSGFAGAEGLTVLENSAKAASAGMTDTATAAQAITATLNAYGLEAAESADVSDVLFKTVDQGVIGFGELSGVIGDVVGTAAAAKVGIDQVGSAIATMTLTGIGGAEAGTSLNRVLQSVIQPSKALGAELEKLGYESGAQALETDGLRVVMDKLRVSTGGNITTLLELFPEIRAARGALALMANEGKNYARVSAQIEDAEKRRGATQKALNEQMKAFSNQVTLAKNKIDAIAISGGTKLLPVLLALMSAAGTLGHELGEGIGAAADALAPAFEDLWHSAQNLWEIAGDLVDVLGPVAVNLLKLGGAPVVLGLRMVAQILETVTGVMADHKTVVLALVIAYGALRVASMLAAGGGATVMAWRAISTVLVGTMAAADGATAAMNRLKIATAAATLGATLVIAGAVNAWMSYSHAADKAADAVEGANKAIEGGSLGALEKQRAALAKTRAELQKQVDGFTGESPLKRFFDWGGAAGAVGAIHALDDIDRAMKKVDASSFKAKENIVRYLRETMSSTAFEALLHNQKDLDAAMLSTAAHASEMGVKTSGSYAVMSAGLRAYASTHSGAEAAVATLVKSMGQLAAGTGDAEEAVDGLKTALDTLIGGPLAQEEALIKWEEAIDSLTASIKENGTTLNANTEKGRANRQAIAASVSALKDRIETDAKAGASGEKLGAKMESGAKRIVKTAVAAGMSEKAVRKMIEQFGLTPDLIDTLIKTSGTGQSKAEIQAVQDKLNALQDKTINVTTRMTTIGQGPLANKSVPQLHGGIRRFAAGGMLPGQATIAPDGADLIQWAERGTGGEAFIPLGANKRGRSKDLLKQVAAIFGMGVQSFANGGTTPTAGNTAAGVSRIAARTPASDSVAEINRAIAAMGRLTQAYEDHRATAGMNAREKQRYHAEQLIALKQEQVQARLAIATNRQQWAFDHMSAQQQIANIDARLKKEKKYSDAWMSLQQQRAGIVESVRAAEAAAAAEAARLAEEAAARQERINQNYSDWVFEHMNQQQQIAELDRRMATSQPFTDEWMSAAREKESILRDIAAAEREAAEAAAEHAQQLRDNQSAWEFEHMNSQQQIADLDRRIAATEKYSDEWLALSRQREDLARDPAHEDALALAGALQANPGLGLLGLARVSGKGVSDVVGLLERFWGTVFAPLGSAASQVAADRKLIEQGKQPSGMAKGGIISGANTGLYYKWAEPGTGGESLIPLGQRDRPRAIDLWNQTGRMLGVTPSGGKTSSSLVVAPGAVKVAVSVSGSNLTPRDVQVATTKAVNDALGTMLQKVRAGNRG